MENIKTTQQEIDTLSKEKILCSNDLEKSIDLLPQTKKLNEQIIHLDKIQDLFNIENI